MQKENQPHPNQAFIDQAINWLPGASFAEAMRFYEDFVLDSSCDEHTIGEIARYDRYFLLTHILDRPDAIHPWLYERTREVEQTKDQCLDLWAREHYKSTIITFAGSIQEIILDPEITIGIFSHTKGIAKSFLGQIKMELEKNQKLKRLYPDIFYEHPDNGSERWSLDAGIVVKRKTNPKEGTIEAWGLVDGQPTSRHFKLMIYDDVVTDKSVGTPEQIMKTTSAWELSRNLSSVDDETGERRTWTIGTRYNYADTYQVMLDRDVYKTRVYPATDDGTMDGKPVFMSQKDWDNKKKESSDYIIACQMLQNPNAGSNRELKPEWVRQWEIRPRTLNVYIMFDYAGSRKSTGSSNSAGSAIGIDANRNKYLLDAVCHKMDLTERWKWIRDTRKKWVNAPGVQVVEVGYERFGAQSDIQYFEEMMKIEGIAFEIKELNWPSDGSVGKDNRIRRLIPDHKNWRFFYPYGGPETSAQRDALARGEGYLVSRPIKRINEEGIVYNVVEWYLTNEYMFFPNTVKKDLLDSMSRIYDMDPVPPIIIKDEDLLPEYEED